MGQRKERIFRTNTIMQTAEARNFLVLNFFYVLLKTCANDEKTRTYLKTGTSRAGNVCEWGRRGGVKNILSKIKEKTAAERQKKIVCICM